MRICFIGDSFVQGTGDDECLGWVGRLCSLARKAGHDITGYNLGVRRDTSADIRARWQGEVNRRRAPEDSLGLVFSFGANDCTLDEASGAPRVAPASTLSNAAAIFDAAQRIAPILMIGPLPVLDDGASDRRIADLSREIAALCGARGIPYLAVFDAMIACPAWRDAAAAGDGSHPNAAGYTALAHLVAAWPAWRTWLR